MRRTRSCTSAEVLWPEFDVAELEAALAFFASRERRFGLTQEQLQRPRRQVAPAHERRRERRLRHARRCVVLGGGFLAVVLLLPAVATLYRAHC